MTEDGKLLALVIGIILLLVMCAKDDDSQPYGPEDCVPVYYNSGVVCE